MSQRLSHRVQALREALRREREAHEEGSTSHSANNDAWLETKEGGIPLQVVGLTDQRPATKADEDPWSDPHFQPANSRPDTIESIIANSTSEDLRAAAERTLAESWHESPKELAKRQKAARQLVASITDDEITNVARAFLARVADRYLADAEGENYRAVLRELIRVHCPGLVYFRDDDDESIEKAVVYLFEHNHFTVDKLISAFESLMARGEMPVVFAGQQRISNAQRRAAQVQAAGGDLQNAIITLLQAAGIPIGDATSMEEIFEILGDESYADVIFDSVVSCWSATAAALQAGYIDNEANRAAIRQMIGGRPATVQNIAAAWEQVKRGRRPPSLPEQHAAAINRPPSLDELNDLSDEAVSDLLNSVVRERARSQRPRLL